MAWKYSGELNFEVSFWTMQVVSSQTSLLSTMFQKSWTKREALRLLIFSQG